MPYTRRWTETEKKTLEEHYPYLSSKELSRAYEGRSARALNDMAQRLHIQKSAERKKEMGMQLVDALRRKRGVKPPS
jgi:hypothetical protein